MIKTVFSRCPVGTATEYLMKKGLLGDALQKVGGEYCVLQDMDATYHNAHFTQEAPLHFRDGGNIPPMWAQSQGDRSVLLGVTYQQEARGIYVRKDSDIHCIEDLKGKRIALPVRKDAVIDFRYLTILRGFDETLMYYGLSLADTEPVYVSASSISMRKVYDKVVQTPTDFMTEDFFAVEEGRADAAFANSVKVVRHDRAKLFRNILSAEEQRLIPNNNNNAVLAITCTKPFAYEHPEIVCAYLKELIKAGLYIKDNPQDFLETTASDIYGATTEEFASSFDNVQLFQRVPELTDKSLNLLNDRKEFLLRHNIIAREKDYDIAKWADGSFLQAARQELERDGKI